MPTRRCASYLKVTVIRMTAANINALLRTRVWTCAMDGTHFQISLFGQMRGLQDILVQAVDASVSTGPQKVQT
jgi:hypothetical protein